MTTSRLTESQQAEVTRWFKTCKLGLVGIISVKGKEVDYSFESSEERAQDINKVNYELRTREGRYDNGVAVRLGKRIGSKRDDHDGYCAGVDLDKWSAIVEWFGPVDTWNKVLEYARTNIVQWHKSRENLHVFYFTDKPIKNTSVKVGDGGEISIRCEGQLMRVSPTVHEEDGKEFCSIDSSQIPRIDSLRLQAKIDSIPGNDGYMPDGDKKYYERWLNLPSTIITPPGRHDALKFIVLRYFYKYEKHWRKYTDQMRFDLVWKWNTDHCEPPKPIEEFDSLREWVISHHKEKRDEVHKQLPKQSEDERRQTHAASLMFLAKSICKELFLDQYRKPYATIVSGGKLGVSAEEFFLRQAEQEAKEEAVKVRERADRAGDIHKNGADLAPTIAIPPTVTQQKPIIVGGHIETIPLNSQRFRNYILGIYYKLTRDRIPSAETVKNVVNVLCFFAEHEGGRKTLYERVTGVPGWSVIYDLTNDAWEIVNIGRKGWRIEDTPTSIFRRHNNEVAQVYPSRDYPKDILHQFIGLLNIKDDNHKLLVKCYIISLFIPEIPKAILMPYGPQGAAKTLLMELIRDLVDPRAVKTLIFHSRVEEIVQALSHNFIAYFDNISKIPEWVSNMLCRACTGAGFSKRELFSDDTDVIYNFKRAVGVNGISLASNKADLLSRSLIFPLEFIPEEKRRLDSEVRSKFNELKAKLLGFIFDTLVKVLNTVETVKIDFHKFPRMADFALYGETISRCLGYEKNKFADAYAENEKLQTEQIIETSPIAHVIIKFMEDKSEVTGTASEWLSKLTTYANTMDLNTRAKNWPKAPNYLSKLLHEIEATLKAKDIEVAWSKDVGSKKIRTIKVRKVSSPSSPSSLEHEKGDDTQKTLESSSPVSSPETEHKNGQRDGRDGRDDVFPTFRPQLQQLIFRTFPRDNGTGVGGEGIQDSNSSNNNNNNSMSHRSHYASDISTCMECGQTLSKLEDRLQHLRSAHGEIFHD